MHDRDELIRKRAHQIWEEEGRPEGMGELHWKRAQDEIDGLAAIGDSDFDADDRRATDGDVEEVPLFTTREAAAFSMANSAPSTKKR